MKNYLWVVERKWSDKKDWEWLQVHENREQARVGKKESVFDSSLCDLYTAEHRIVKYVREKQMNLVNSFLTTLYVCFLITCFILAIENYPGVTFTIAAFSFIWFVIHKGLFS